MTERPALLKLLGVVHQLRSTSSSKKKELILLETLNHDYKSSIHQLLLATYDPNKMYYMTSSTALSNRSLCDVDAANHYTLLHLLDMFTKRKISGSSQIALWNGYVSRYDGNAYKYKKELGPLVRSILDKDLGCGIGVVTINKAIRRTQQYKNRVISLIPEFNVALGVPWKEGIQIDFENERWYASRKMNGVRCLVDISGGVVGEPTSRQGKEFTTLGMVKKDLLCCSEEFDGYIVDGEVALANSDGHDDFPGIMKQIRRKYHTIENPKLHVFDLIDLKSFRDGFGGARFSKRIVNYRALCKKAGVSIVPVNQVWIRSTEQFRELCDKVKRLGWEGLVLRKSTPYLGKRSNDLIKVKTMQEIEARVVSTKHGKFSTVMDGRVTKLTGMLSASIIYKGNRVNVGSGWSRQERLRYYKFPKKLIGNVITVQFFEETKTKKGSSLQFPVVKCVHGKEREI
jgi:DNA ligase-1